MEKQMMKSGAVEVFWYLYSAINESSGTKCPVGNMVTNVVRMILNRSFFET